MKNLIETISRLWWIKVRGELTNPHSEKSMKALEEVLVEDLCFDDFVVDYVMEAIGDEPKDSEEETEEKEDETSDEETTNDKEKADKDIKYGSLTQLEKDKLKEDDTPDEETANDKGKADKDIKYGSLTQLEKDRLEEIDDKLLKHKLKNPTTGNMNQVSTLLGKKKSDPAAYQVGKDFLGDQGVSDDEIGKQSDSDKDDDGDDKGKQDDEEPNVNTVHGDPEGGDNKVKNEMLEHGYNGIEDATGNKPAPGNPGSAYNEIVSGEGIHMLDKNPNMTEQELAQKMYDQFGDSTLGQEQTQASGIPKEDYPPHINENLDKAKITQKEYLEKVLGKKPSKKKEPKAYKEYEEKLKTLKKNDPPTEEGNQFQENQKAINKAEKDKAVMSKCIIAARSSKQKHKNSTQRTKKLQDDGLMGENTKTHTFYGADDSKQAQKDVVEKANKVLLPNGMEVSKQDAIDFIGEGGGGDNPSDTATFVTDDEGNVMLQFHSDKMSTGDIQDNSTLAKEGDNYKGYVDKTEGLTSEQKEKAKGLIDKYSEEMDKIEQNYNDLATPIAKRLNELPIEEQLDIIEKDEGTLKKNVHEAIFVKGSGAFREKYKKYLPEGKEPEDLTDAEKYEMVRKLVVNGEGKTDDTKVVNKVASAVQKRNPELEGLDVKKNLAEQRQKVVDTQRKRVEELNKTKVNIDGVEKGLGDMMEADECIRGFHLGLMNDNEYKKPEDESGMSDEEKQKAQKQRFKGIMDSAFDSNMGGIVVTGETLKKCLGANNTTDLKKKFKLEEPTGKDNKGRDARYSYDKKGNITGKKVYVYSVDDKGDSVKIGYKTYRSKAGSDGKTSNTMQYSKGTQECFKNNQ
jgi:hypothetical protein